MNWDHVRFFIAVAEQGSVAAAARYLGVNHATVLRRVEGLEEDLGIRLFNRMPDGYRLTDLGEQVLQAAQPMLSGADAMARAAKAEPQVKPLVISPPGVGVVDLDQWAVDFLLENPQIPLELRVDHRKTDVERLESDIVIRVTDQPPLELLGREVGVMRFALFAAKQTDPTLTIEQLPWVFWSSESSFEQLEQMHLRMEIQPTVILRTNRLEQALVALQAGLGVGFLPAAWGLRQKGIKLLDQAPFSPGTKVWLLTHKDYRGNVAVRVVMDSLAQELAEQLRLDI